MIAHFAWPMWGFLMTLIPICFAFMHLVRTPAVCRASSCPLPCTKLLAVICLGLIRIGEASNPGPAVHFEDCQFTLGSFNPSGLRNKAHYFSSHLSEGDLWMISETHFFGHDVPKFRAGLRAAKSGHDYVVSDQSSLKPCLTSQTSWKGVAVMSKHPTRALPSGMPSSVTNSGRALLTTTLLSDVWISGGVVYGEPDGHRHPNHVRNTEFLLHHVASHICHLSNGPRYVSGDWNVSQDSLPAFDILTNAGFREVQDLGFERWGIPVQNTCKSKTRKDFMYLSPELQDILVGVDVLHDVWPDHSVLVAKFISPKAMPCVFTWPTPAVFPWPHDFGHDIQWQDNANPTEAYQQLWQHIEHSAAARCPFPVPAKALGRAQRLHRKRTKLPQNTPLKLGRVGDFQPEFFGSSRRHAQWIRQTRRLQAFARLCASRSDHAGIQRAESWGAILRSSGFHPSFSAWWFDLQFRADGAPATCPDRPPNEDVAWAMFDSLSMAVRDLEKQLMKQSRQYARFRRCQNPNLVFADIRPPAIPGIELLLQPIKTTVEEICEDEQKLVLAMPCDFHPERPIVCDGMPVSVVHHEGDAIWTEDVSHFKVGSTVCQTRMLGTHEELSREFIDAWKKRWMRHADVPAERWNTIIDFAKAHMRPNRFQWDPIGPLELQQIVKSKKKSSAHGMDGVRLADLCNMPVRVHQAFCDMFRTAETSGQWPSQLVNGKVVSLAKVPTPGSPSDFRPITIFGLLYRCWSSFHSRKALLALEPHLPDTLYGSRQGRHATQLWSKLLWAIEWSYQHDVALSGVVLDLQKAFNLLPRLAVFEIAAHVGIPMNVLIGWAGALSQMHRHFLIRNSLSEGVPSVTGFPEGCGLSCIAMVLVDAAFHQWQQAYFPLCTALSYVDDWQLLCSHHSLIQGAQASLDRFIHAMDLIVDVRKCYAWSLSAEGRHALRQQGTRVVLAGKNLGAHIQTSRKHTNSSLMERVQNMQSIWPKLRISACRYAVKIRALKVAAWPRALHAVAATCLSDSAFHSLRSGAMRGLDADSAGSNPWIQLGLIEHPSADPQFWAVIQTIRCIRECGEPDQVVPRLVALTTGNTSLPENGITATLLTRLQSLGWHVAQDGLIADMFGLFALFQVSLQEIVMRAIWAWQLVVAQKVSHRPGFFNLQFADAVDARCWLKQLPCDDQILFQKCLNGCHITQDGKSHCQEGGSEQCPYCQCSDSRYHRFWQCERFAHRRAHLPHDLQVLLPSLPEFLTGYGWSLRPHTMLQWYRMLAEIPCSPLVVLEPLHHDIHLFTDGSCLNQASPGCRVASWAVVCAAPNEMSGGQVVDLGPLPGLIQSSYRAEIYAVWRALVAARKHQGSVHIWTDCKAVLVRTRRLLRGGELRVNGAHYDLWCCVSEALHEFRPGQVCITKVKAHQGICQANTPLEEWCFWHNQVADQAASRAQWDRPVDFWKFYELHVSTTLACQSISRQVQQVLLAISQDVVREDEDIDAVPREDLCVSPPTPTDAWVHLPQFSVPQAAVRWYGDRMVRTILSWFWFAVSGRDHPVIWVSQWQLYLDYMLCGESGPLHLQGWQNGTDCPEVDLLAISFHVRARWLAKVLKESLRHLQLKCVYRFCRPASEALMLHTGCLALPWDPARLRVVDEWFFSQCPAGVRRTSKVMQSLPVAARDERLPPVFVSSV